MLSEADRRPEATVTRDTSPLRYSQHLGYNLTYALASLVVAYPLGLAQRALFASAGCGAGPFCHRATDMPFYPFLPALFLGFVVSFPLFVRLLRWYLGERFFAMLDRPDRSTVRMSLRQDIQVFSRVAWGVAILATLVNLAAFDTFLQVTDSELRYSTFFSPVTYRHSITEVQELVIYSRRMAPNRNIVNKPFLEVRLHGGNALDTFHLIETEHIPEVVATLEANPLFKAVVTRVDGYKR